MFRCSGVQVFRCSGVQVCRCLVCSGCLGCLKGDQGGGPKMAKILGGVKIQRFGLPFRPKKCF